MASYPKIYLEDDLLTHCIKFLVEQSRGFHFFSSGGVLQRNWGCSAEIQNDGIFITQYNVVLFENLNFEEYIFV